MLFQQICLGIKSFMQIYLFTKLFRVKEKAKRNSRVNENAQGSYQLNKDFEMFFKEIEKFK